MSEFIEKRRELAIKEYEFMKHLKLFTGDEIRDIKNKRFQHEHRVERRAKELTDYINYIVYESSLLELLRERRKKLRVRDGKHGLDNSIQIRIKVLYKRAMERFPAEYQLWMHYFKYCEKNKFTADASRMLDRMLNYHGDKPRAWISAANWEHEKMNNMDKAKHFMFRGLQRHPDCREMYLRFVEMMLKEAEKIEQVEEGTENQEQNVSRLGQILECVKLIYQHYKQKDTDLEFFIELLDCLKKINVTKTFGFEVLNDMKKTFAKKELMWHTLARLALEGSYLLSEKTCQQEKPSFKICLQQCIQIYETAIEAVPTKEMWSYYVETILQQNADMSCYPKLRRKALGEAFKKAYFAGFLEEDRYVQYIKLLIHSEETQFSFVSEVLSKALEVYPSSSQLWELQLTCLVRKCASAKEFESVFKQAINKCSSDVLPLWIVRSQFYYTQTENQNKLEQVFREAIQQSTSVSSHFQPLFLNYLVVTKNIDAARKEYREMQRNCKPCLELHHKMAELESIQMQPNFDQVRTIHENATQYFGTSNADVWIDYIRFERDNGSPKTIHTIFERAKMRLNADLMADFIVKYEQVKNPLL
ncbi:U3 small nucleolar RNA-associated protein 6 homolog [Topomyia yanbarensis]|uniref:U3 small nucleolar RNA-associated protein 6 homolog n=1 Tax=Topomyia yanbarensis TaxID=2498891 RepID=UPI00273B0293|nr:U3 small nucleolar RNA-associated protein 6 homolog [Topomyia yanbarensis]